MILEIALAVSLATSAYFLYKHVSLKTAVADVKAELVKAETTATADAKSVYAYVSAKLKSL